MISGREHRTPNHHQAQQFAFELQASVIPSTHVTDEFSVGKQRPSKASSKSEAVDTGSRTREASIEISKIGNGIAPRVIKIVINQRRMSIQQSELLLSLLHLRQQQPAYLMRANETENENEC